MGIAWDYYNSVVSKRVWGYLMIIIIYIRTSTIEQNPENQLESCKRLNTWGEFEVVEDQQSAWKDNKERVGFNRVKDLIKHKQVSHLIVWDLDRLYRNRKKLISFFELCKVYDCKVHSSRQDWLEKLHNIPEPFNEITHSLMLNIMGWLAEEESKKKSDRVKAAIRKDNGVTRSYKGNKWGKPKLLKNVASKVIELHISGKPIREIATLVHYWDKSNNKHQVSKSAVHKILQDHKRIKQ